MVAFDNASEAVVLTWLIVVLLPSAVLFASFAVFTVESSFVACSLIVDWMPLTVASSAALLSNAPFAVFVVSARSARIRPASVVSSVFVEYFLSASLVDV